MRLQPMGLRCGLGAAAATLLLALQGGCGRTATRAAAPAPPAAAAPGAAASRPNILFAIADDASHLHFGAYGADWVETPSFDRRR